jgi:hypothetical protein
MRRKTRWRRLEALRSQLRPILNNSRRPTKRFSDKEKLPHGMVRVLHR